MERPPLDSLAKGLEELLAVGAFDERGQLTRNGKLMAECPLTPQLSRVLIESAKLGCAEECLSIIAMLSVDNLFSISTEDREQSTVAKRNMAHPTGDHLTLLNIYNAFRTARDTERWCQDNYVDGKSIKQVVEVRNQLVGFCEKSGLNVVSCGNEVDVVLKCFCAGFHTQLALLQTDRSHRTLLGRQQVFIHPSSVLHMKRGDCILFHEVTLTTKCYLRNVSIVQADWALEFIQQK
jgi:HrpA-like RNA helicase